MIRIFFPSSHFASALICWLTLLACNDTNSVDNEQGDQVDTLHTDTTTTDTLQQRILIFSKTLGYHHESIADGNEALLQLGSAHNFHVDTTTNAAYFTGDSLKGYAVVVFLSTTGDVLNDDQQAAFEHYIRAGGGYVGIHAASDTEYDWDWYGGLVGGYFASHPSIQEATLDVLDRTHLATAHLSDQWIKRDEWYNFKEWDEGVNVLITIDENTYEGGTMGTPHPISWYHEYEGGRAFYTAMGHTKESYSDSLFLKHVLGGIRYVSGSE